MALILYLETATTVCSVALAEGNNLLALKEENNGFTHAEHLTIFIEEVLAISSKKASDLQAIVVSKGPGSYTGLRIGVSTAKGLCYGLQIPLIGINSLTSMALGAAKKHATINCFCPMIDARRMEVYTACCDSNGAEITATEAHILEVDSFLAQLNTQKVLFFGDGAAKFETLCIHPNAVFVNDCLPSAANMIALGHQLFIEQNFEDTAYFEPYYLKEFYTTASKK